MSFFSNLVVPALLCLVFLVAVLRRVDLLSKSYRRFTAERRTGYRHRR